MYGYSYKYGNYKGSLEGLCEKYKLDYAEVVKFIYDHDCDYREALDSMIPKLTPFSYKKRSMTLEEWSKVVKIPAKVLFIRIVHYNWSVASALTSSCRSKGKER